MFFKKFTRLSAEVIDEKLSQCTGPKSGNVSFEALPPGNIDIVFDDGLTLSYAIESGDTLSFSENGGAPVTVRYGALKMEQIVLISHLIPKTRYAYHVAIDMRTGLVTAFETWFCGFEHDLREVHRHIRHGYVKREGAAPPEKRHTLTNRVEGKGFYWKDSTGYETLTFYPSVMWSSFIELNTPDGGLTVTAPSDFIRIDDVFFIYSRVECEYSGTLTLEVIDLFHIAKIGVRIGFDEYDNLEYVMYTGWGKITGHSSTFEPFNDYGTEIVLSPDSKNRPKPGKGQRPVYRPRFLYKDFTKEEVDALIREKLRLFEGKTIMSSYNTMEETDALAGRTLTLKYDDGPAWEYTFVDGRTLKFRPAGSDKWQEEQYRAFEPAKDIFFFSHIVTGSDPFRNLTHAVDVSTALCTCIDAQVGNGRKVWEVGHKALFGVVEGRGVTPPSVRRHGFTTDLVGKAFAWIYSDVMSSIHVYSSPESYSWTIMLPNYAGGFMWSSPCLYIKLREDAYLFSWTEDTCNGNQGTMVFNPNLMHDAGFFFGVGDDDVHLSAMGAYARAAGGFDILKYFDIKRPGSEL